VVDCNRTPPPLRRANLADKVLGMRIIAGEHRGRRLESPPGDTTRPITDRAKQSLFDVLAPLLGGAVVADLFCGTGSMGLECISRGAERALFFDADRGALAALKRNIAALRVEPASTVVPGDLFKLAATTLPPQVDLIFLDPPYRFLTERAEALQALAQVLAGRLTPDGVVSFRHDTADALELPGLSPKRTLEYGSMTIELLGRDAGGDGANRMASA
jgi:16S rRNA (guanine966-N2)-methyltransferase